jgi:purine-cytosine permease-like protein
MQTMKRWTGPTAATCENSSFDADAVGLWARRGPVTMGLVWVSMVASFPCVLIGLDWHRQGFSLPTVLWSLLLNMAILLLYSIPMCVIAAKTGLSFKFLCRKYFGDGFSKLLTVCVILLYLGWYGVVSLLMADATCAMIGGKQYLAPMAFMFSFAMAFNNFFGFKGVANFARFIGGPAVICWIVYMFAKVAPDIPHCLEHASTTVSLPLVFCGVSQSIVGFVIWGNEADYWRNSTTNKVGIGFSLAAALFIGAVIFPLTGWLMGARTGITDAMVATAYLNKFAFGGAGIIALLFVAAQYFAANDSNLYAFAHGVESFTKMTHKKVVLALGFLAGILAAGLAVSGTQNALEACCALNGVILPTASLIVLAECIVIRRWDLSENNKIPAVRYSAVIAWSCGMLLGVITSGIIPGTKVLNVGVPILEAWALALALYIALRKREIAASTVSTDEKHQPVVQAVGTGATAIKHATLVN